MIASLHIENVAVVKSLDVEFLSGMTVLSGEIRSLYERASREQVSARYLRMLEKP